MGMGSWPGHVRALHRPLPPRAGSRQRRSPSPPAQLHRHRTSAPRPPCRERRNRRHSPRRSRRPPGRRPHRGGRSCRPDRGDVHRIGAVHAPSQEGPGAFVTRSAGPGQQLHRHRAHPPRSAPRGATASPPRCSCPSASTSACCADRSSTGPGAIARRSAATRPRLGRRLPRPRGGGSSAAGGELPPCAQERSVHLFRRPDRRCPARSSSAISTTIFPAESATARST